MYIATEFYASSPGTSFYEIFCIEDRRKPWSLSSDLCYIPRVADWALIDGKQFMETETVLNDYSLPVRIKFTAPTNGTFQHIYKGVYKMGFNLSGQAQLEILIVFCCDTRSFSDFSSKEVSYP